MEKRQKEVKIPKAFEKNRTGRGQQGLPRKRNKWEGMGRWGGAFEREPGWRRAMFKMKHIKGEVEFQSSSKMMSVSQNNIIPS